MSMHSTPRDLASAREEARRPPEPRGQSVPTYAPALSALHDAHAVELATIVRRLGVERATVALDIACGDGAFAGWLAEMVGEEGLVIGVDSNAAYLDRAKVRLEKQGFAQRVKLVEADALSIPLGNASVDFALSAQSLYSLKDPVATFREVRRVLRPGGRIAIVENDMLHHVVASWLPEVDLLMHRLLVEAVADEKVPERFFARYLPELLIEAGFVVEQPTSFSVSRRGPLGLAERLYLDGYLSDVAQRIEPLMKPGDRETLAVVIDREARDRFLRSDLTVIYLYVVAHGIRPAR